MRVAVAQLVSAAGDIEANVATALDAVAQAEGADLLVLPELFLTGYAFAPTVIEASDSRLESLVDAAGRAGLTVLAGAAIAGSPRPTLSTLAISGAGVTHVYDKQHLSGPEQDWFAPGESGTVLDLDAGPVAMAICYDACFPEHGRAAADAGALVYAASVAYFSGSEHRRDLYHRARALDNGFFVAVGALTGECGGASFAGGAAIHDPEGRTLVSVPDGQTGVVTADLDLDAVSHTRRDHPMLAERRDLGTTERI